MKYNQPFGGATDAPYVNGNPAIGVEGSIPPAEQMEYPQREIVAVIQYAKDNNLIDQNGAVCATPANTDLTQLLKAIFGIAKSTIETAVAIGTLSGAAAGGTKTAAWTAFDLAGAAQSLSFDGATTGANGMDTGATPTSGDLSIYAIYNPATVTWATLGCAGSTSNGEVYIGTHMPAGYTVSQLIFSGKTDGSGNIVEFKQRGRTVLLGTIGTIVSGESATSFTAKSIAAIVPANTFAVSGDIDAGTGTAVKVELASDINGIGVKTASWNGGSGSIINSYSDLIVIETGVVYYKVFVGTVAITATINSYRF